MPRKPSLMLVAAALLLTSPAVAQRVTPSAAGTSLSVTAIPPTRLYTEPAVYLLLKLPGDTATVRYTPGSLDRAAHLQTRLELAARSFKRWVDLELEVTLYLLNRDEWRQAGYDVPYGVPVRVGRRGMAAPAEGDAGTVALWSEMLRGILPAVAGSPIRGTPQQAATMILADFVTQLLMCEIMVDEVGIAGADAWVRGLMTHLASVDLVRRHEEVRLRDLDTMYDLLGENLGRRAFSTRDYNPDLGLRDWMWFQAQFHFGAQTIIAEEGKGSVKKMKKLRKRTSGVLNGDLLLRRYDDLNAWYYERFTSVSLRK
ncbi:MAG: hypothetical protein AAF560_10640 [Acidobacteriota bacterium]